MRARMHSFVARETSSILAATREHAGLKTLYWDARRRLISPSPLRGLSLIYMLAPFERYVKILNLPKT